jgi:uncharacterized protein (TIGR00730 family)
VNSVCVYCGSSPGTDASFMDAAIACGTQVAREGLTLVYGGGKVGLMGAVADAALAAGGRVVGVIPQALVGREIAHEGLTELHVVASMHERKALMASLADAFVALPGGVGTLEELFEIWTWAHLGVHAKRCAVLDVADFWSPLLAALDGMVIEGFLRRDVRDLLIHARDVDELFARLATQEPTPAPQWLGADET